MTDTISLQEFLIEIKSFIRRNKWPLSKLAWHTLIYLYSQCDPKEFLWFLNEVQRRESERTFVVNHIRGEAVWKMRA